MTTTKTITAVTDDFAGYSFALKPGHTFAIAHDTLFIATRDGHRIPVAGLREADQIKEAARVEYMTWVEEDGEWDIRDSETIGYVERSYIWVASEVHAEYFAEFVVYAL